MKKSYLKRAMSFILSLALVFSLVPSLVSASDATITVDFTEPSSPSTNCSGTGWALVSSESKVTANAGYDVQRSNGLQMSIANDDGESGWNCLPWLYPIPKAAESKWTIEVDLGTQTPGYYKLDMKYATVSAAGGFYVYADDNYAGYVNCYEADIPFNTGGNKDASLNTVYLTPDANGKVKIAFMYAGTGGAASGQWRGISLFNNLTLTPVSNYTAPSDYALVDTLPTGTTEMNTGDAIDLTAYLESPTAGVFHTNGYKSDRTEDADNNIKLSITGESVALSGTNAIDTQNVLGTEFDGVLKGKLTAVKGGTSVVTLSATANGKAYEKKVVIDVIEPEPHEITIDYTRDSITCENNTVSSTWQAYGFSFVSTGARSAIPPYKVGNYSAFRVTTSWQEWPVASKYEGNMYIVSKKIHNAGWYSVKVLGGIYNNFTQYSIYVDGKYAGDYNFHDGTILSSQPYQLGEEKKLNAIYVPVGDVEIGFYARKQYTGENYFIPIYLKLTPVEAPTVTSVETEIPSELSAGESADLTARAKMSDGTYRSFGYKTDGTKPTDTNIIKVTSSAPDVVEVSDVVCIEDSVTGDYTQVIDPTKTTYKLTAKKSGKATVTVTALVDGVETKSFEKTVTVPSADVDAEDIDTNISYIVRAKDSANNSKITVSDASYTVNGVNVGGWTVGKSFTVTADAENFAYWANSNGTPVSTDASYTFAPKSSFTLEAVYVPSEATTKTVHFWNYNKTFIGEVVAEGESLGNKMPQNPTLNGWNFTGWASEKTNAFDANTLLTDPVTRVVAQFDAIENNFSVKVSGVEKGKYTYDSPVRITAPEAPENKVFSHWVVTGTDIIVCYESTMDFYVWNNVDLTPVYADATPAKVPTVVLDKVNDNEYFIAYVVPEGYTAVDAGIVFSENGLPGVKSSDSKASVKNVGAMGQFTAAPGDAAQTKARGYVMYKDNATGALRVLYSK
ncbi:MAG: hypothetical protein E7473_01250 [Ruminococcaceae bacterium]|nr:hypothetical protein [Oscillospiraceae bacterium]